MSYFHIQYRHPTVGFAQQPVNIKEQTPEKQGPFPWNKTKVIQFVHSNQIINEHWLTMAKQAALCIEGIAPDDLSPIEDNFRKKITDGIRQLESDLSGLWALLRRILRPHEYREKKNLISELEKILVKKIEPEAVPEHAKHQKVEIPQNLQQEELIINIHHPYEQNHDLTESDIHTLKSLLNKISITDSIEQEIHTIINKISNLIHPDNRKQNILIKQALPPTSLSEKKQEGVNSGNLAERHSPHAVNSDIPISRPLKPTGRNPADNLENPSLSLGEQQQQPAKANQDRLKQEISNGIALRKVTATVSTTEQQGTAAEDKRLPAIGLFDQIKSGVALRKTEVPLAQTTKARSGYGLFDINAVDQLLSRRKILQGEDDESDAESDAGYTSDWD